MKNLPDWQKIYTTAGRTGRAKYQLCTSTNVVYLSQGHLFSFHFLSNFALNSLFFQIHIEDGQELWRARSTFSEQEILTQLYFNYYANLHLVSVVWGLVYLNVKLFIVYLICK